jgi:hypothetical protein
VVEFVAVDSDDVLCVRIPAGNELSANDLWVPGGTTIGNLPEAVISRVPRGAYHEMIVGAPVSCAHD